jgi:predicted dinucleotide-binding enzyme
MPEGLEFKIAIIGAGNVGASLGKALAAKGHTIIYGVRNPASEKTRAALAALRNKAVATGIADAIGVADLIVLAVRWPDAEEVIRGIADQLKDKIVIDTTNVFGEAVQRGRSAAETLAHIAPGARFVKCFNTIGVEHYLDPVFDGQPATMFLCGDDEEARTFVGWLVSDLGFEVLDAGPLANAEMLEAMARLWVYLGRSPLGRDIAFRLVKK